MWNYQNTLDFSQNSQNTHLLQPHPPPPNPHPKPNPKIFTPPDSTLSSLLLPTANPIFHPKTPKIFLPPPNILTHPLFTKPNSNLHTKLTRPTSSYCPTVRRTSMQGSATTRLTVARCGVLGLRWQSTLDERQGRRHHRVGCVSGRHLCGRSAYAACPRRIGVGLGEEKGRRGWSVVEDAGKERNKRGEGSACEGGEEKKNLEEGNKVGR